MKTAEVIDIHSRLPIVSEHKPNSDYHLKVEKVIVPDTSPEDVQTVRLLANAFAKHVPKNSQSHK